MPVWLPANSAQFLGNKGDTEMTEQKKTMVIDGKEVEFTNERNILEVCRKEGIDIPTFCYQPELSIFGACRMCLVEIEGRGINSSCSTPPENGLKIKTNTTEIRKLRRMTMESWR